MVVMHPLRIPLRGWLRLLPLLCLFFGTRAALADGPLKADYRQPKHIVFLESDTALVTTRLSGELYELRLNPVALDASELIAVYCDPRCRWGKAIMLAPGTIAVAEHHAEQIVIFQRRAAGWAPACRLAVPGQAHSLIWDSGLQQLLVSGLWSQQLFRWQLAAADPSDDANWQPLPTVDLHMCGGEVLLLPKHELVLVADAFGRNYRLLDRRSGQVIKSDRVYGHNIAALASVHDESLVLFPHQLLSPYSQSVRNEITWGGVVSNNLRWLRIERMRDQVGQEIFKQGRFYSLGANGNGAGDPTDLAISATGLFAITLGGTDRVAIGFEDDYYFRQIDVGRHPVSCKFSPNGETLVVVNQFSDSLSLIRLADDRLVHLPLGELRNLTAAERGEQAFFDARLSHDGWMSCHSCHSQGHTCGQLNDNYSDHSFGTPKRIPTLLGQAETAPYSWSGSLGELESQIELSIRSTMASDDPVSPATVSEIATFLRTLSAPPSLSDARLPKDHRRSRTEQVAVANPPALRGGEIQSDSEIPHRGRPLFEELGCSDCHAGPWLTSPDSFDIGLADEAEQRYFNPPSLIAVSQRQDALLHHAGASSLRDFLANHAHQLPRELSAEELAQLLAYLEQL